MHKKWPLYIAAAVVLWGCFSKICYAIPPFDRTKPAKESQKTEPAFPDFPKITVIDTLPAVDETTQSVETPLPSSEINNLIDQNILQKQPARQADGSFSYFFVTRAICHDHDVCYAVPQGGQISWSGTGVSVTYHSEREREALHKLDAKNVVGDDCEEFNESMEKTRQLIADGFLQDVFAEYLSHFPELELEDKTLTLELYSAERTDRLSDGFACWELDYDLSVELENGGRHMIATMDIYKPLLIDGYEDTWDDAHYRIWGYPQNMWELMEQPQEDRGKAMINVLPEGTFTDEASIDAYMEQFAKERQITWKRTKESRFWNDYLVWEGDGGGYHYRMAVPLLNEDAGSWLIQAVFQTGAESPEECLDAMSTLMDSFHANPHCYRVKKGDTLSDIARTYMGYDSQYPLLADINGLTNPDLIYEGQWIEIPFHYLNPAPD